MQSIGGPPLPTVTDIQLFFFFSWYDAITHNSLQNYRTYKPPMFRVVCPDVLLSLLCVPELEWPREAAGAG